MSDFFTFLLAVITTGFLFFLAASDYLNLPIVYLSNASGVCTKIELADGTIIGCENLKKFDRFETVWVP